MSDGSTIEWLAWPGHRAGRLLDGRTHDEVPEVGR